MSTPNFKQHALHAACAMALVSAASLSLAQDATNSGASERDTLHDQAAATGDSPRSMTRDTLESAGASSGQADSSDRMEKLSQQLDKARTMADRMKADPKVSALVGQAKGIFFIPKYGQGALIVGAKGGKGVMVANKDGTWSNPAFYNMGGVSFGAQAGAEVGEIAMLLMSDKAVNSFKQNNKFSLDATAGLTIVNYTAKAQEEAGRGDIVVWSDTKGAFADLAVGVTDINFDKDDNRAFYGKTVTAADIMKDTSTHQKAKELNQALAGK